MDARAKAYDVYQSRLADLGHYHVFCKERGWEPLPEMTEELTRAAEDARRNWDAARFVQEAENLAREENNG